MYHTDDPFWNRYDSLISNNIIMALIVNHGYNLNSMLFILSSFISLNNIFQISVIMFIGKKIIHLNNSMLFFFLLLSTWHAMIGLHGRGPQSTNGPYSWSYNMGQIIHVQVWCRAAYENWLLGLGWLCNKTHWSTNGRVKKSEKW